ncbi:MAG: ABC transporter substrate-binding protein [Candidatus Rokubacteria bacterium]|nr:ABC transporter substrate-binding protein [Candidatus Rokubacteria bacterium]
MDTRDLVCRACLVLGVFALLTGVAGRGAAGDAIDQLRPSIDQVLRILDDGSATVRTRIVSRQRPDLPVDYRMHQVGGRWLVYDVLVEVTSLVANYRSQFHTIIRTSSYAELIHRIKSRLAGLAAPSPAAMVRPRHPAGGLGMAPMFAALARGPIAKP